MIIRPPETLTVGYRELPLEHDFQFDPLPLYSDIGRSLDHCCCGLLALFRSADVTNNFRISLLVESGTSSAYCDAVSHTGEPVLNHLRYGFGTFHRKEMTVLPKSEDASLWSKFDNLRRIGFANRTEARAIGQ